MTMQTQANTAISIALSAAIGDLSDYATYERRVRMMFGNGAGGALLKRGDHAVREAAATLCERCVDRLARGHWSYDMNEHLAAKALYESASARVKNAERGAMAVAAE